MTTKEINNRNKRKQKATPIDMEILGMPLGNIRIVGVMEPGKHYIARLEEQK